MSKKNVNESNTTTTTTYTFVQAPDSTKAVIATKGNDTTTPVYVAHELYTKNKDIVEALGGKVIKGVKGFRAEFAKVANAKAFIKKAVTHISEAEYNAARKTEPKAPAKKAAPTNGKGRKTAVEYVTVTDSDGLTYKVPKSTLSPAAAPAPAKKTTKRGKGADKPTPASTKKGAKSTAKTEKPAPKRGRKAKGDGFDFSTIKGADNKAKNKALHQALVKMGLADSRTAEYQAVWSARPWAK